MVDAVNSNALTGTQNDAVFSSTRVEDLRSSLANITKNIINSSKTKRVRNRIRNRIPHSQQKKQADLDLQDANAFPVLTSNTTNSDNLKQSKTTITTTLPQQTWKLSKIDLKISRSPAGFSHMTQEYEYKKEVRRVDQCVTAVPFCSKLNFLNALMNTQPFGKFKLLNSLFWGRPSSTTNTIMERPLNMTSSSSSSPIKLAPVPIIMKQKQQQSSKKNVVGSSSSKLYSIWRIVRERKTNNLLSSSSVTIDQHHNNSSKQSTTTTQVANIFSYLVKSVLGQTQQNLRAQKRQAYKSRSSLSFYPVWMQQQQQSVSGTTTSSSSSKKSIFHRRNPLNSWITPAALFH